MLKMKVVVPNGGEIDDIKRIFVRNGFPRTTTYNQHIYRARLGANARCCLCYDSEELAGMYAVVPARFKIGGSFLLSYQSLDTIVDQDYRGQKLFQKTALTLYTNLENEGECLVYGFPNVNSFSGFRKYLDWKFLDPVPFLIRPISLSYFIKSNVLSHLLSFIRFPVFSFGSKRLKHFYEFPDLPGLDALCEDFCQSYEVGVHRSLDYLRDRYKFAPEKRYQYIVLTDQASQLRGFGVFCVEEKHGGRIGYVMEVIAHHNDVKSLGKLIGEIVRQCNRARADCVLAWCFNHSLPYKGYRSNLFVPIPERIRPVELHFGYRYRGGYYSSLLTHRRSWFISYSDSDTV